MHISIHTLRMERDVIPIINGQTGHISIHTLRMERDAVIADTLIRPIISIHTLRMERDRPTGSRSFRVRDFNPHAPHGA